MKQPRIKTQSVAGFTLSELLITTVIVGVLSAIALPNYLNQVNRTRQNEAASTVAQIQTTIVSYADEFGQLPNTWADLNKTAAIMTNSGPADIGPETEAGGTNAKTSYFPEITLPNGYYKITIEDDDNKFTITASRSDEEDLYVIGCLDLTNGASTIIKGPETESNSTPGMNDFCPHPEPPDNENP